MIHNLYCYEFTFYIVNRISIVLPMFDVNNVKIVLHFTGN